MRLFLLNVILGFWTVCRPFSVFNCFFFLNIVDCFLDVRNAVKMHIVLKLLLLLLTNCACIPVKMIIIESRVLSWVG
jgi:hypothetical protein